MTLPKGWVEATIADIASQRSGNGKLIKGKLESQPAANLFPAYSASGQDVWRDGYDHEGDAIIVSAVGARCGKAFRASGKWSAIANTHIVEAESDAVDVDYLFLLLNDEDFWIKGGTAQPFVKARATFERTLDLPPRAEQRRIVAKLDALTARLARARAELDRVPVLAAKLRGASLDSAFSGGLTADLREDSSGVRQLPPVLDDQERGKWRDDSLPNSWRWVVFSDFFSDVTDSSRKLPTNQYEAHGRYPVIDQGAAPIGGRTDCEELVHSAAERVIIFGDHTRCVKLVDPPFVQGADGVKVLATNAGIDVEYARYALMAVEIPAKGYSRHMKFVKRTVWPVAPETEQAAVVQRLNAAFARADRMEAEAARARALIDRLEAAILGRAFRGELVPQDPDDEPASVLLERIRAQRAAAPKPKRGRRKKASP